MALLLSWYFFAVTFALNIILFIFMTLITHQSTLNSFLPCLWQKRADKLSFYKRKTPETGRDSHFQQTLLKQEEVAHSLGTIYSGGLIPCRSQDHSVQVYVHSCFTATIQECCGPKMRCRCDFSPFSVDTFVFQPLKLHSWRRFPVFLIWCSHSFLPVCVCACVCCGDQSTCYFFFNAVVSFVLKWHSLVSPVMTDDLHRYWWHWLLIFCRSQFSQMSAGYVVVHIRSFWWIS